jgi:hypothetical protein
MLADVVGEDGAEGVVGVFGGLVSQVMDLRVILKVRDQQSR